MSLAEDSVLGGMLRRLLENGSYGIGENLFSLEGSIEIDDDEQRLLLRILGSGGTDG